MDETKPIKILDRILIKGYNDGIISKDVINYFIKEMPETCGKENCHNCDDFVNDMKKLINVVEQMSFDI